MENKTENKILWKDRLRHLGLPLSFTKYYIDDDRLYVQKGFFKTTIDEILLYRIIDVKSTRSLGQKLFGVGTVTLYSADQTDKILELKNVKNAGKVHRFLSDKVEKERVARRIVGREMVGAAGAMMHTDPHDMDLHHIDDDGHCECDHDHDDVSFDDFR